MTEPIADVLMIQQRPQRQDSLEDQLVDLHVLAARLGCYDAADWIWRRGLRTRAVREALLRGGDRS